MGTINNVSTGTAIIIILLIFPCVYPNAQAQINIPFNPADKFSIPSYNGMVSFAVNGSYSNATFENDSWTFTNLQLNNSLPLENFRVSAQNCNVTIFSYAAFNFTRQTLLLTYAVEGHGKQSFNFGVGPQTGQFAGIDWSVITQKSVFLTQGVDWTLSPDGTVVVNGATGNFTIIHFGFYDDNLSTSNLPLYEQHSVAIAIIAAVAIVVAVAVVIKVKNHESSSKNEPIGDDSKGSKLTNGKMPR